MRPISSTGLDRRYAPLQQAAWLLTLCAGDWTWRAATLPATVGGIVYPPRLGADGHWREELPQDSRPGGLVHARAELRALDLPGDEDSLRGRLAITPPIGVEATLRLAWLDGGVAAEDDTAVLLQGRVAGWRIDPLGVRLTLIDELQAQGARRVGRLLRAAMIGGQGSPSLGQTLPWIFGRVLDAGLIPLRAGVTGRLAQAIEPGEVMVPLCSIKGFPPQGRAQLGRDIFEYMFSGIVGYEPDNPDNQVIMFLDVKGGQITGNYPKGAPTLLAPEEGFQWLVADHPCKRVESVRADGATVDPADWSASTIQLGDATAQIITMAQWPLNGEGRPAQRISATVQGWANDQGTLIENPADVIHWLLTHARLAALPAARVDASSFTGVGGELAARGHRFARRLTGDETLGSLLDGAAHEAGVWISGGDPIRLLVADPTPRPERVQEDLDATKYLNALEPARVNAPVGFIPPDAVELVGAPLTQGLGRPSYQFPPESEASGTIPQRFQIDWLDLGSVKAAGDLGELFWTHLGEAPFSAEQDYPLGAALLAAGETVRINHLPLDLNETPAWVSAVEARVGARARVTLHGPWTGTYAWKQDYDNYFRCHAFGGQMSLILAGRPVARLSRTGTLRLAGRMSEEANLNAGPFPTPVAVSGGCLYLNFKSGSFYTPFLRIDAHGDGDLAGTLSERSTVRISHSGQPLCAEEGGFWLAPDALHGAFEYHASDSVLHLKGILIESIRL